MGNFLQGLKKLVKTKGGRVAFPESTDLRILQALNQLLLDKLISEVILFDSREVILKLAKKKKLTAISKEKKRLVFWDELSSRAQEVREFLKKQMKHKP